MGMLGLLIALVIGGLYVFAGLYGLTDNADRAWQQHERLMRMDGLEAKRTPEWERRYEQNRPFRYVLMIVALLFGGFLILAAISGLLQLQR